MNGKICMPLTGAPNSNPSAGKVYVWVDESKELKSMDDTGAITEYTGVDTSSIEARIAANEGVIDFHSDDLRYIQNTLIADLDQDVTDLNDEVDTLETEMESAKDDIANNTSGLGQSFLMINNNASGVADCFSYAATIDNLAQTAKERADDAYVLASEGSGVAPVEPVDASSLVDENDVVQAEAIEGFLQVKNRLTFIGPSVRIGEGTGESDSPAGVGGEIAIGKNACFGAGSKTNGIGIGVQALYNTSGTANIGIGLNSGNGNSGNYNVNIGNSAGQYRIISSSNINIGYASGYNGRGNDNIYLGGWAGSVAASNSIIENKMLRIGTKGGATAEFLDKELIIGNMDPDVDGGQWLLVNGKLRIKSPNGNQWTIKVDDSGNISADAVN